MISSLLLEAALALAPTLPEPVLSLLARATSRLEFAFASARRRAVLSNLTQIAGSGRLAEAGPGCLTRTARAMFGSYHRFLLEYLAQGSMDSRAIDSRFRFLGMETLYRALGPERGAVVSAPHVGNWELAGIALARLGFRVHVVTGTQFRGQLTGVARILKERERILVSTPGDGFRPLLETLKLGGIVVLLTDGDVFVRSIDTLFFGRSVPFPVGPAILARRARVRLLHAHAERRASGGHVVSFDGMETPDPSLSAREDIRRLTRRVAECQERVIAAHVDQWCIFRPLFARAGAA